MQEINKQEYWKSIYDDFKSTNLTQYEYCQKKQLVYYQFGYWKRKFDRVNSSNEDFIEVINGGTNQADPTTNPTSTKSQIQITIKDITIHVHSDSVAFIEQIKSIFKL